LRPCLECTTLNVGGSHQTAGNIAKVGSVSKELRDHSRANLFAHKSAEPFFLIEGCAMNSNKLVVLEFLLLAALMVLVTAASFWPHA
jgi:hypothetical protein